MSFLAPRSPLKAVIFDWAGTTIDHGSRAPAGAFQELFRRHGVAASIAQARGPMGMHKRDHIAAMLAMPELAAQWLQAHGAAPGEADLDALFEAFIPLQLEALPHFLDLIPGIPALAAQLRERSLKIGATTGYNDAMMALCQEAARKGGYEPEVSVAASQVPAGRPAPWMAVKAAMELQVYPWESIVKVGDTVTDVEEGLNGGMWTIGITRTGNEVGLSLEEAEALDPTALDALIEHADRKLRAAGAHYVVESAADILPVLDAINDRLARGERP
jgi:phosphonoacetaldehyde hydrolase